MASREHLNCSDYIKSVHKQLREDTKILGPDQAWKKHCCNTYKLEKYAAAMKELAVQHWDTNCNNKSHTFSRVLWCVNTVKEYFTTEIIKYRHKEHEIAAKIDLEVQHIEEDSSKIKLLDVGSCYNPFKDYTFLDSVPIDIAPATSDVYKCDFLEVELVRDIALRVASGIKQLQLESFHVVVFSLVLEYLPTPQQRLLFCEKAYQILRPEGILIIITPDSKHVGANAKIMKSWRFVLAKMGFMRIKYEKLKYLHCMIFRKSLKKEIAERWAALQNPERFFNDIIIPQDFNEGNSTEVIKSQLKDQEKCDATLFAELPQL